MVAKATWTLVLVTWCSVALSSHARLEELTSRLEELQKEFDELENQINEGGRYADENEAKKWMDVFNKNAVKITNEYNEASWQFMTNMTDYNSQKAEAASIKQAQWMREQQKEAKKYYNRSPLFYDEDFIRKLKKVVVAAADPMVDDEKKVRELKQVSLKLASLYSNATVTHRNHQYSLDPDLTRVMATSRDPIELLWAWESWHDVTGRYMKDHYQQLVYLQNEGARANGFEDMGAYWRVSNYEIDNIENITSELYTQIEPLYKELHAYVRKKLREFYPKLNIPKRGPIPAHLLGNMWAQEWQNIMDIVSPYPDVPSFDVTTEMVRQDYTPERMFRTAEQFFTSIGLEPMTDKFWEKSMIEKPDDGRVVNCHGSAEDMFSKDDFRIKMCTDVTQTDLQTVHHEMGHIEYFMEYKDQPYIFREGANAAFHEAVGDTVGLSVMTQSHLQTLGLLNISHDNNDSLQYKRDINFLLRMALEKIAFLPFGYLVDLWRWGVYKGEITPENYNRKWWEYRMKYQGLSPPVARTEEDFDPGAKFHIPNDVPYIRYFLSFIEQFQFHKSLCNAKQHRGPIHLCDIYNSTEAGTLLKNMLKLGSSKPWPDAMETLTGNRRFDPTAIIDYFRPLTQWLIGQNQNEAGWDDIKVKVSREVDETEAEEFQMDDREIY